MASAEHDKYMVAYRESQARERESQVRETASRKGNVSDVRIERVEQPNLWDEPFNQMRNGKVTIKYKGYTIFAGFGIQYSNNRPYSWNFSVSEYYGIAYSYDEMIKKIKEKVVANY